MIDYAFYNGIFAPYDAMTIPISDRAFFFADAVYDVLIGHGKGVHNVPQHLDRLNKNAKEIGLDFTLSEDYFTEITDKLVELSCHDCFSIYVQLSASGIRRSHLRTSPDVNILITLTGAQIPELPEKISAITIPDRRYDFCNIKTVNLLPAVLSVEMAVKRGADIAIFESGGWITECSHANIFILKDGVLITPPLSSKILPGITRDTLIRLALKKGIPTIERQISKDEIHEADAVLITSTTHFLRICNRIDEVACSLKDEKTVLELFSLLRDNFLNLA